MYDNENNEHHPTILPDGGTVAAQGSSVGQTKLDVPNALQQSGGDGYSMFEAQSNLDFALRQYGPESQQAAQAAEQVHSFRSNAFFGDTEWKTLDNRVVAVREDEATIFDDLRNRGLVTNTDLSTVIYEYERSPAVLRGDAAISMGLEDRSQDELMGYGEEFDGIPLPIVHKSYHLNRRTMNVAGRSGVNINTDAVDIATRSILDTMSDMLIDGWNVNVDGYTVPGFRNFTPRMTVVGSNWQDTVNVSASRIRGDLLTGVEMLEDAGYNEGSDGYVLYVSREEQQILRRREVGTDNQRQLVTKLNEELDFIDMVRTTSLPPGEAILFKPIPEVVELVVASDIQNVEWESHAGFTTHMKVMGSITPLLKSTAGAKTGIVHYTGLQG